MKLSIATVLACIAIGVMPNPVPNPNHLSITIDVFDGLEAPHHGSPSSIFPYASPVRNCPTILTFGVASIQSLVPQACLTNGSKAPMILYPSPSSADLC